MIIHPDEISKKWIDRMADAGIRVMGIHPTGGRNACDSLKALVEEMKTPRYREWIDYAAAKGLEVEYELHTAGYLMPKSLFASHPEYFRMNENGERVCDWNFCVSNPDALDLFAKRAAELAVSLYGSNHNFNFWMDDAKNSHCHCPKCQKLSPSDQQLMAVNAMIREIKRVIPDARMAYLAYFDTIIPPHTLQAEDGVFLEYAPFEKYTAGKENAAYLIEREWNMLEPLMQFFGRENAKVLEYWYDNSLYSHWKKPPAKFVLQKEAMIKDMERYRPLGFDRVATFACFLGSDYEELYGDVDIMPFANCF